MPATSTALRRLVTAEGWRWMWMRAVCASPPGQSLASRCELMCIAARGCTEQGEARRQAAAIPSNLAAQPQQVAVDRWIAPPTTTSERSVPDSVHSAPQYSNACHAYQPGGTPLAPGFSHHGNIYVKPGGWYNGSYVDPVDVMNL
jgi:hypothetical protein